MNNSILKACEIVGGQTALARALNVTTPAVNHWISGLRPVPIVQAVSIERLTGGKVTRKELRPSDWKEIWPELSEAA